MERHSLTTKGDSPGKSRTAEKRLRQSLSDTMDFSLAKLIVDQKAKMEQK